MQVLAAILCISVAVAQQPAAVKRAEVLLLGTYHFANPNLDQVKTDFDDHTSERRQREIREVCTLLAKFAPTRVAVEATAGDALQRDYVAYREGKRELRANESEQLGMRVAGMLGHERVFGIDSKLDLDLSAVMGAAQRNGPKDLLAVLGQTMERVQRLQQSLVKMTVRDALLAMNDRELLPLGRDMYLRLTSIRDGDQNVGADQVARWYQRNFRMFANIAGLVASPDERVLVVVGAGHCPILRELVQADPRLQFVEPLDYLKPK